MEGIVLEKDSFHKEIVTALLRGKNGSHISRISDWVNFLVKLSKYCHDLFLNLSVFNDQEQFKQNLGCTNVLHFTTAEFQKSCTKPAKYINEMFWSLMILNHGKI